MTDRDDIQREYQDNVPQEQVQDTPLWGEENQLPEERGQDYWEDVTTENRDPEGEGVSE